MSMIRIISMLATEDEGQCTEIGTCDFDIVFVIIAASSFDVVGDHCRRSIRGVWWMTWCCVSCFCCCHVKIKMSLEIESLLSSQKNESLRGGKIGHTY